MRLPALIDTDLFPVAELAALRLDGDAFPVGAAVVAADAPVDDAVRAAALVGEAGRYGLVAADRVAAWVHGAVSRPPAPLRFSVDLGVGVRTRNLPVSPREVRFARGDLTVLAGLKVTTPLRTAIDLARLEDGFPDATAVAVAYLLVLAGATPAEAVAALAVMPAAPGKARAATRLTRLACGQPALTRYTS